MNTESFGFPYQNNQSLVMNDLAIQPGIFGYRVFIFIQIS